MQGFIKCVDVSFFLITNYDQVACALLMAGENLDNHIDVKNILVDMGIYFQVQVIIVAQPHWFIVSKYSSKFKIFVCDKIFFLSATKLAISPLVSLWPLALIISQNFLLSFH